MKRPGAVEKTLERICRWREICPTLTLRSTFIVGFPGETEADFELLLDFLQQARLDRVGCFKYSPVDGAQANTLPDQVPEEIKEIRYYRFMQLQQQISKQRLQEKVGSKIWIMKGQLAVVWLLMRLKLMVLFILMANLMLNLVILFRR